MRREKASKELVICNHETRASLKVTNDYDMRHSQILGKGAFGIVFKAYKKHDKNKNEPYALKVIEKNLFEFSNDEDPIEDLRNEI